MKLSKLPGLSRLDWIMIILIVMFACVMLLIGILKGKQTIKSKKVKREGGGACGAVPREDHSPSPSCGAMDPVNEPNYNMQEVIKNTLLLEQHLAEKRKYCKECICKHFLINIGYLQEAIQMAGNTCDRYPKLEESLGIHESLFKVWGAQKDDDGIRLDTLEKLRQWRREVLRLYYF